MAYSGKGRIFNIQRFSIHDGYGIRTIVFFKGCYMRCAWCCNPESQEYGLETLAENGKEKLVGRDVTVEEIMPELLADMPYYRRSGGGITLSGGECLAQHEFARDLLKACRENGLHTAIESTANVPYSHIEQVLPYLDLFLMDVKLMDGAKHKEYTGAENALILENAKKLAQSGGELVIRTPVVPGVNDTREEIGAIARFAASLKTVKEHHLLPYHRLGQDKYDGLGRSYALKGIEPPSRERMEYLKACAEESGLHVQIGG